MIMSIEIEMSNEKGMMKDCQVKNHAGRECAVRESLHLRRYPALRERACT